MNINVMKYLCMKTQDELFQNVYAFIKERYKVVHLTSEYIFAEGEVPVCLVAHLDTVFKRPPHNIYYDKEQSVMWSPQGLGADDRAGVYAILEIINMGFRPSVIFTTDEEVGGLGAQAVIEDFKQCPIKDLKMIIELDRNGMDDCVFYDCDNVEFEQYISAFGFTPTWGTFSDISIIAPAWGIAAVNLSIGYMYEHTTNEILYGKFLDDTINKVCKILKSIDKDTPQFQYIPMVATYATECMLCRAPLHVGNYQKVSFKGMDIYICTECLDKYYLPARNEKLNF